MSVYTDIDADESADGEHAMNGLRDQAGAYRADRRNAARRAHTLRNWRHRARIKTSVFGLRTETKIVGHNEDGSPITKERIYRVHTYMVAAS